MEVQTEFLWDEKNSIEQPMNYENKNEQETSDTTNDTKTSSTQVDWRDITDPKLRKKMYRKAYNQANKQKNKEYYKLNKEKIKEREKKYREVNKEELREKRKTRYEANKYKVKQYTETNKDKIKEYKKTHYEANKDKIKEYKKNWYQANKDKIKNYLEANKDKLKEKSKIYYEVNKEEINAYGRAYNKANRNKINKYYRNRSSINIQFKLSHNLRSRLASAIKKNSKSGSAIKDLGCTIDELKIYLESKFQEGMSWNNYGFYGWHIDHVKPLSSFDLTDRNQFLQACHYTNLQPLWAKDNLSKKDRHQE